MHKHLKNKIFLLVILFIGCNSLESQNRKKINTFNQNSEEFKDLVADNFGKYEAGDDIAYTYDETDELQLNYIKTSKKGKQPLLIFIPPGSFLKYDKDELLTMHMSREFARAGFNTASISYTLLTDIGWGDMRQDKLPIYIKAKISDAINDVSQAVSFLINKHQELNFDPNNVFLVGHSAGAIITLHAVFSNSEELNNYTEGYEIAYKRPRIKGAIAISGALLADHYDDSDIKNTPLLLFHGNQDETVPIGYENTYKKLITDTDITFPQVILQIKSNLINRKQTSLKSLRTAYHIPKWVFKYTIGQIMPRVIGSQNIFDTSLKNVQLNVIEGGKHAFMVNENGSLNHSYKIMREKMYAFLKKQSKN